MAFPNIVIGLFIIYNFENGCLLRKGLIVAANYNFHLKARAIVLEVFSIRFRLIQLKVSFGNYGGL